MSKLKIFVCLIGILCFVSASFGQSQAADPNYGGTLRAFSSTDPLTLDPAALASWDQSVMAGNLLEGLVRLSPDGTQIEPGIADTWTVSEDGLMWSFHIRDNAKFHNGETITANDVKYSFERVIDPDTRSPRAWIFEAVEGFDEFRSGDADEVTGIRVINDSTVEIELDQALTPFLSMLASPSAALVPRTAVEEWGDEFGRHVVSAGPFRLADWRPNLDITLEAFEDYWDGRPYIDTLEYRFILDENTRMVELLSGNLDWAWIPPAYYNQVSSDPQFSDSIGRANTLHVGYLVMNLDKEPFGDNKLLRQAIRYAIDTEAVVASLQGRSNTPVGPFPPGVVGFDENAAPYPHDVEKAKQLLAEAGYPNGIEEPIQVILPPWNNLIKILEIYQANLREVGVDIEIVPTDFGAYLTALDEGNYTMAWGFRVADYADPDAFAYPLLHSSSIGGGGNVARYENPEIDQLIEQGRLSTDPDERAEIYETIARIVEEELPYLMLSHNIWVDVTTPRVKGFVPSAMDVHMFHRAWLEE